MKPTHEQLVKAKIPCAETGIEIKHTLCDICCPGDHCGINAYVKDGVVIKVEGDPNHPYNHGKLCPKGSSNRQYIYREDRIRTPLRRVGERGEGKFEPISWDEAYKEIADHLLPIREKYGPNSVVFFSGFTKWYRPWLQRFAYSFGSVNYCSENSVCFKTTQAAWMLTAGTMVGMDFENANVILGWAMNPYYSAHAVVPGLLELKKQGKKFIIIDPRRTPAVEQLADIHLQIKPGTDSALALGMAKIIIDNNWHDKEFIEKYTYGFEEYKEYVSQFTLDKVAAITGLDPDDIYRATEMYATNGPAAINDPAIPVTHHINGFQNIRAIICLNALTGNFDRPGGAIPAEETYYDQYAGYKTHEHEFFLCRHPGNPMDRIGARRFPVWQHVMPEAQAMDLVRQMEEGTPYPVKAIFAMGMNAKMFPETKRLLRDIKDLDFFVNTDLFMTSTCKYADIVLPACSSFERGEFKAYPGGYASYTKPVIPPLYESKPDTQMLAELSKVMHLNDELLEAGYEAGIRFMLRDLSVTVDDMKASDEPILVPEACPIPPGLTLANGFNTPSGKFEFKSKIVEAYEESHGLSAIPTYRDTLEDNPDAEGFPLLLNTGSRLPNMIHSRLHNVAWARYLNNGPTARMNPEDAAERGIEEGDPVELYTDVGSVHVKAHLTIKVRRGDVHLFQGYDEANANDLISMWHVDPYTGFCGYKSIRCNVRKITE